jgi:hypothetical protein
MFDALVAWAPTDVDRVEAKVRGVHLLFHNGLSQMGLTYWVRSRTESGPGGRTSPAVTIGAPNVLAPLAHNSRAHVAVTEAPGDAAARAEHPAACFGKLIP